MNNNYKSKKYFSNYNLLLRKSDSGHVFDEQFEFKLLISMLENTFQILNTSELFIYNIQ